MFVTKLNPQFKFEKAKEHKINYTRMGEPFLNLNSIQTCIWSIDQIYPNTHHFISTIGIKGSNFSWIKDNMTLQISLHATNDDARKKLIPYKHLMSIEELGQIRTKRMNLRCPILRVNQG